MTHRKDIALMAYAQPTPNAAMTSPPMAGPNTEAV